MEKEEKREEKKGSEMREKEKSGHGGVNVIMWLFQSTKTSIALAQS